MDSKAEFPDNLTPSGLPSALEKDRSCLVWDFTADSINDDDDKDLGDYHVKIYLTTPEQQEVLVQGSEIGKGVICTKAEEAAAECHDSHHDGDQVVEASVLQYQRQLRKTQAAKRAGADLTDDQLEIIFQDNAIAVVNKPAGVLCVPGIHNNDSIANLLFARQSPKEVQAHQLLLEEEGDHATATTSRDDDDKCLDACSMAVHRLDMDTSGLVVFGKIKSAVSILHQVFRREHDDNQPKCNKHKKKRKLPFVTGTVTKEYEALICGHLPSLIKTGYIDLPLQRDVHHPPFMRVSTPHSEALARCVVDALRERNWTKLTKRNPKSSQTMFRVIAREYYQTSPGSEAQKQIPVTRLALTPITGRTHQLRVHCAAMGFPIVGDPVYGIYGESASCGGLHDNNIQIMSKSAALDNKDMPSWRAPVALQKELMQLHPPGEKSMCLHAKRLGFPHPITGETMEWEVPPKF
jgi:tRNA pseudouridine32 synthase / 23S rRNA pseudouridine746 synthase